MFDKLDQISKFLRQFKPGKFWAGCGLAFPFMFLSLFGRETAELFPLVDMKKVDAWCNFMDWLEPFIDTSLGRVTCCVVFGITCSLLFLRVWYKRRILLLGHKSMQYEIGEIDPAFENQYYIKKEIINLGELPDGSKDTIITALQSQNMQADIIMAKKGKRPVYYYGTAHMPLVCALGYRYGGQIGQQHYLHRENRQAGNTIFTELKYQNSNEIYDFTSVEFTQELQSKQLVLRNRSKALKPRRSHRLSAGTMCPAMCWWHLMNS